MFQQFEEHILMPLDSSGPLPYIHSITHSSIHIFLFLTIVHNNNKHQLKIKVEDNQEKENAT